MGATSDREVRTHRVAPLRGVATLPETGGNFTVKQVATLREIGKFANPPSSLRGIQGVRTMQLGRMAREHPPAAEPFGRSSAAGRALSE